MILKKNLTLIDTYVLPGFYSKDRYYNGLWENLSSKEKKSIYFLSSITYTKNRNGFNLIGNIYKVYSELRNSKRPFIVKEDYIYISDIFYAVFYSIRIKFIKFDDIKHKSINYNSLLIEDLNNLKRFLTYVFYKSVI